MMTVSARLNNLFALHASVSFRVSAHSAAWTR
jgi:hypothetical protein